MASTRLFQLSALRNSLPRLTSTASARFSTASRVAFPATATDTPASSTTPSPSSSTESSTSSAPSSTAAASSSASTSEAGTDPIFITFEPANPFKTPLQAWLRDFKTNEPQSLIEIQRSVFGAPLRKDILHRVVVWQQDALRQGTQSTKGRADVSGTSKKAAPQKGRGAARVGSLRAPHRRGGGIAFGPKPRDHSSELPRKVQEMGLRVALSTKFAQDQLVIVDGVSLDSHKTREFEKIVDKHGWDSVLVVTHQDNEALRRATSNLAQVDVALMQETDVLRLLKREMVVMDRRSVRYLEKKLKV